MVIRDQTSHSGQFCWFGPVAESIRSLYAYYIYVLHWSIVGAHRLRSCAGHIALWTYHAYQTSVIQWYHKDAEVCSIIRAQIGKKLKLSSPLLWLTSSLSLSLETGAIKESHAKPEWQPGECWMANKRKWCCVSEQTLQSLDVQSTLSEDALLEAEKHIPNISKDSKTHYCISIDMSSETCGSYFFST